jgi:hypothetical protein
MRTLISVILSASLALCPASIALAQAEADTTIAEHPDSTKAQEYSESAGWMKCHQQGKEDGSKLGTTGSFIGGLAGGVLLGLIGTGIAVLVQSTPEPSADKLEALEREECRYAYTEAYESKGKGKKRTSALIGGLVGTAVLVGIIVASNSSDSS